MVENAKLVEDQVMTLPKGHIDHVVILGKSIVEGVSVADTKGFISKGQVKQLATKIGLPDGDAQLSQMASPSPPQGMIIRKPLAAIPMNNDV